MFKDLIPDGTQVNCQSNGYPRTIYWKAFIRYAYVGSINSKPYWHNTHKTMNNMTYIRATRNWRPWWRDVWIRRSESEILRPEMKESRQGHQQKASEICQRWKEACCFRHDENKRRKSMRPSFPAPETQTKSDGKNSSKGKSFADQRPSGKGSRSSCKDYITGKCTSPSCDSWHPPVCQNCKTELGRKCGEKCSFMQRGFCSQVNKRPNKNGGKGFVVF